jgi:hypothetical protein
MKKENRWEAIPVRPDTKIRVNSFGKKGEIYDEIINRLCDMAEKTKH